MSPDPEPRPAREGDLVVDTSGELERAVQQDLQRIRAGSLLARNDAANELTRELDHWSGAEIEQMVSSALFRAYGERKDLTDEHLRAAARDLVPLATLYEEKIQALRQWGQARARRASADAYEQPVLLARAEGSSAERVEALERARVLALRVRAEMEGRRRRGERVGGARRRGRATPCSATATRKPMPDRRRG